MKEETYLEFLRYCIDDTLKLPASAKDIDWMDLMDWAKRQAIVGIIFQGVDRSHESLQIPFKERIEWSGYMHFIEEQNTQMNKRCVELVGEFRKDGFDCCVLKGQGNAMMYPNPLLRNSGDIDLLVFEPIREVIKYVRSKNPNGKTVYHHIDYGLYKDVEVEVHYRPSFLNNLIANRRLQAWFCANKDFSHIDLPEGVGRITVPSWEFNVVFQLSHIYRHVIQSGLGLRQVIDYYYLLKSNTNLQLDGVNRTDGTNIPELLKRLGLMEIAGAVMWVLKEVLGMDERYLIVPVDERRGRFLLEEIMEGGNFGMWLKPDAGWLNGDSAIGRNILRLKRDLKLVRYFPSECLWEPVFRVWHFFWRMTH